MGSTQNVKKEGWFTTKNRPGDRTLEQQLKGLDPLFALCQNKTVLDVGCAEGLISIALARAGAAAVHGVEIVPGHVDVGNRLRGPLPVTLEVADANTWKPKRDYDIVILLALLHKLRDPSEGCRRFVARARDLVVLRLPPGAAPSIKDERSGFVEHKIADVLVEMGFELVSEAFDGPFEEYVAYWKRVR